MDPEIAAWRTRERTRLLEVRRNLSSADRTRITNAIVESLGHALDVMPCSVLGLYWPIKGEFDIRAWAGAAGEAKGLRLALPVVVRKHAPLEYWGWRAGDAMERGFWGIMVPQQRCLLQPDVVIAPLVGFANPYRLGYGGGYFDRTLAAANPRPLAIGIGLESARLDGFVPQQHDIAMDMIVTEAMMHLPPAPR